MKKNEIPSQHLSLLYYIALRRLTYWVRYMEEGPIVEKGRRILQAKIQKVVYVDPYPEDEAVEILEKGGVFTEKFEGVKAQAYYKLFHPYQESLEKKIEERLKAI